MHDDFELVKRKKHRKRKSNSKNLNFTDIIVTDINKKLENVLEEFQSSQFCFELLHTLDRAVKSLNSKSVDEILCFGLGNFHESKSSLHQLAALIKFQEKYNSTVNVYDPVFTSLEIKTLENFKFNILEDNEEGKRKVSGSQTTLVFLPHCPKQLTNNFLWANWNLSLCNCIIIANSFSKIVQNNTSKTLKESANYILKINPKTVELTLRDCYHIENIFNDISVHYFSLENINENFFTESLELEPEYLEDIELITRSTKLLTIKNE